MAKHSLLHRADCHASGVAEQYAAAVKGTATIYLCAHHAQRFVDILPAQGWRIVSINDKETVPA